MRRIGILRAAAGVFAIQAAGAAYPESGPISLSLIESETGAPELRGAGPAQARSPAAEIPKTGNPLWAIPMSKLSATRERPLFSESRRARTPTVAAAPAPPRTGPVVAETPPLTLVGTIIGEENRIAIFFDENSKTAAGVREGELASGWTLRTVEPRSAVLEGRGRTVTLDLPEPAGSEPPGPEGAGPESAAPLVSASPLK